MVPVDWSCLALVACASRGRMAGQEPLLLLLASMAAGLLFEEEGRPRRPVCHGDPRQSMVCGSRDGGGVQPRPRAAYIWVSRRIAVRVLCNSAITKASYRQAPEVLRREAAPFH